MWHKSKDEIQAEQNFDAAINFGLLEELDLLHDPLKSAKSTDCPKKPFLGLTDDQSQELNEIFLLIKAALALEPTCEEEAEL